MKAEILLSMCVVVLGSCVAEQPAGPPEPIGEELMSFTTALGVPGCVEAHLYRAREAVQYQCFATDGNLLLGESGDSLRAGQGGSRDRSGCGGPDEHDAKRCGGILR